MRHFDPPAPILPQGLFAGTLFLPFRAPLVFFSAAWPTIIALLLLDLWEPGRTWRSFGAVTFSFIINDILFLIGLAPLVLAWGRLVPDLFNGKRLTADWLLPLISIFHLRSLTLFIGLCLALLTAFCVLQMTSSAIIAGASELLGDIVPIGLTVWASDVLKGLALGIAFWFGLSLARCMREPSKGLLLPAIGWLPRCLLAAFVFGALHYIAGENVIPMVAEPLSHIDVFLAQGTYRGLGGVLTLLLTAWIAAYIAVIAAAVLHAEASD